MPVASSILTSTHALTSLDCTCHSVYHHCVLRDVSLFNLPCTRYLHYAKSPADSSFNQPTMSAWLALAAEASLNVGLAEDVSYSMHRLLASNLEATCSAGRRDDLWSWLYMLAEMLNGHLPWKDAGKAATNGRPAGSPEEQKQVEKQTVLEAKLACLADPSLLFTIAPLPGTCLHTPPPLPPPQGPLFCLDVLLHPLSPSPLVSRIGAVLKPS